MFMVYHMNIDSVLNTEYIFLNTIMLQDFEK